MSELSKRLLVALVGIPLSMVIIYYGGYFLLVLIYLLTHIAYTELARIFRVKSIQLNVFLLDLFTYSVLTLISNHLVTSYFPTINLLLVILFFVAIALKSLWSKNWEAPLNLAAEIFSFVYITIGFGSFLAIRELNQISYFVNNLKFDNWTIFPFLFSVWVCDSGAYFVGRMLGKHKLFEKHSPKKTIEGAIGGFTFTFIGFYIYFNYFKLGVFGFIDIVMFSIIVGVFGQLGDLFQSMLKRWAGLKDSGNLLPGHGGVLDRFDSILIVMPLILVYLLVKQVFQF